MIILEEGTVKIALKILEIQFQLHVFSRQRESVVTRDC